MSLNQKTSANIARVNAQNARRSMTSELVNEIYQEIDTAASRGYFAAKIFTNRDYRPVIDEITDKLKTDGYMVTFRSNCLRVSW